MFIMLYGTLEQFITLTLSNGWAGRKANMGMKKDEVLSGIANFQYQGTFLLLHLTSELFNMKQENDYWFLVYTNKKQMKEVRLFKDCKYITYTYILNYYK